MGGPGGTTMTAQRSQQPDKLPLSEWLFGALRIGAPA